MTAIEMRRMKRFDLEIPAFMRVANGQEDESMELTTSDVCSGGALFHTRQSMPVGTEVEVDLLLPVRQLDKIDTGKVILEIAGSVIRADEKSMAVRFGKKYKIIPFKSCGAVLLDRSVPSEFLGETARIRKIPWTFGTSRQSKQRVSATH